MLELAEKIHTRLADNDFDVFNHTRSVIGRFLENAKCGQNHLTVPGYKERFGRHPDSHVHLWPEIFLQVGGRLLFDFGSGKCTLDAGEILVMPSGLAHAETGRRYRSPFLNMVFIFRQGETLFHFAEAEHGKKPYSRRGARIKTPLSQSLGAYLHDLSAGKISSSPHWPLARDGILQAFFALLMDVLERNQPEERPAEHEKILAVRYLVTQHLAEPDLSVATLARNLRCSADYLSHLYRTETGSTLSRYINECRISLARGLLGEQHLNITEVAYACGYRDPGYFSRVFKAETGLSPRRFRQHNFGLT